MSARTDYLTSAARLYANLILIGERVVVRTSNGPKDRAEGAAEFAKQVPELERLLADFYEGVVLRADDAIGALSAQQRKDLFVSILEALHDGPEVAARFRDFAETAIQDAAE